MRSAWIMIVVLAVPTTAWAGDEPTPLEAVEELAAYIEKDGADFEGANPLYKAAKDALAAEAKAGGDAPAQARYDEIRSRVADVMRRNEMPTSAWLMGFFGATLLWGGFAFCVGVARKRGGGKGGG